MLYRIWNSPTLADCTNENSFVLTGIFVPRRVKIIPKNFAGTPVQSKIGRSKNSSVRSVLRSGLYFATSTVHLVRGPRLLHMRSIAVMLAPFAVIISRYRYAVQQIGRASCRERV